MPSQADPALVDSLFARNAFGAKLHWSTVDTATGRTVIIYNFWSPADGTAPKAVPAGIARAMTPDERAGVELAMQRIQEVAAIEFRYDDGFLNEGADLRFGVVDFGPFHEAATTARAFGSDGAMTWAETWLNDEAPLPDAHLSGGVGQAEIMKQLLMAIGLQAPASADWSHSVLASAPAPGLGAVSVIGDAPVRPETPMLYDVAALQALYGVSPADLASGGDDIYRIDDGVGRLLTIVDGGGVDTIDASGQALAVLIDLNEGAFSSIGRRGVGIEDILEPAQNNVAIAFGTVIENAIGGGGDDMLIGNDVGNVLRGGAGADTLTGGGGANSFVGTLAELAGDRITDFSSADRLVVEDRLLTPSDLTVEQMTGGVRLGIAGQADVLLDGAFTPTAFQVVGDGNGGSVITYEASAQVIAEYGTVSSLTHHAQWVAFEHSFVNPIVIAQPVLFRGSDIVTVAIDEITSDGFRLRLSEPEHLDGIHNTHETTSWMVVEAGSWALGDGTRLEAGTIEHRSLLTAGGNMNGGLITYDTAFDSAPALLTQLQAGGGDEWLVTRTRSLGADAARVYLQRAEMFEETSLLDARQIGYVAIEKGVSAVGETTLAAKTVQGVTHQARAIGFDDLFDAPPHLFAGIASVNERDPGVLRYRNLGADGVDLVIQEEKSKDSETSHAPESVDMLVLSGDGMLFGTAIEPPVS